MADVDWTPYQSGALEERLAERRRLSSGLAMRVAMADDGVKQEHFIALLDTLIGSGFESLAVSDANEVLQICEDIAAEPARE